MLSAPEFKVAYFVLDLERGSNAPYKTCRVDSKPRAQIQEPHFR